MRLALKGIPEVMRKHKSVAPPFGGGIAMPVYPHFPDGLFAMA
jgi:hypothetical protein